MLLVRSSCKMALLDKLLPQLKAWGNASGGSRAPGFGDEASAALANSAELPAAALAAGGGCGAAGGDGGGRKRSRAVGAVGAPHVNYR